MLAAAFLGALVFGRFADQVGRKRVYWLVAAIMIVGALGSALLPSYWMLIAFRFVLGFGVGGDYPVSAVMVSEYANRKDRGKLVGMVFGTQALGLIVGPLIALSLLGSGAGDDLVWRILLGLGAVPAAAVIYLRSRMPESPRYQAQVQGRAEQAASSWTWPASRAASQRGRPAAPQSGCGPSSPTGAGWSCWPARPGCWFLLDYAYYGNTISTPQILSLISPGASTMTKIALQLAIFVVAAVPGYVLAIARLDRIGHRKLQLIGFAMMARLLPVIAAMPGMTTTVAPFLLVYGVSYFFTEFGPNMTTFVMPSEIYPVSMRDDRARHLGRHRQARRLHRRLPVPDPADLAWPARHAAAHRRSRRARPARSPWCCPNPPGAAWRTSPPAASATRPRPRVRSPNKPWHPDSFSSAGNSNRQSSGHSRESPSRQSLGDARLHRSWSGDAPKQAREWPHWSAPEVISRAGQDCGKLPEAARAVAYGSL